MSNFRWSQDLGMHPQLPDMAAGRASRRVPWEQGLGSGMRGRYHRVGGPPARGHRALPGL
uniref:Uncharacterized protein n=1 Tax=Timema shepardi TaxID=629360 RepID=A0A7R9B6D3_TIMSH|nr:unnamed protein product [Timema shepardi]